MKLFGKFEAVRFPEENLIFITHDGYIYYVYNPKYKNWRKHPNTGNDSITVSNYQEVSKEELVDAMFGIFPRKETDFMRLCDPSQLRITDMMNLLNEDYLNYMSNNVIYDSVYRFLLESDICHKSYLRLKKLFDNAFTLQQDNEKVLIQIKDLCFAIIGRDIFKEEIGIVDGHDSSSYFWIKPVRVIDYENTNDLDSVAEMRGVEISIEEDDVNQYLTPFLYKHYDDELEANKKRVDTYETYYNDEKKTVYVSGFEWNLTHNFYTFESVMDILKDIRDTIDALKTERSTEYTVKLREKRGFDTYKLIYDRNLTKEQIKEYNDNRPKEDDTPAEMIIDFYHRFIYRMEYMVRVGEEKGYNLISFMGP